MKQSGDPVNLEKEPIYGHLFKIVLLNSKEILQLNKKDPFIIDRFSESNLQSLGVNFMVSEVQLDGMRIKIQMWHFNPDINFDKNILSHYLSGSHGAILLCNVTKGRNFERTEYWLEKLKEHTDKTSTTLVGYKIRRIRKRKISHNKLASLAKIENLVFTDLVMKRGMSLKKVLYQLCRKIKSELI